MAGEKMMEQGAGQEAPAQEQGGGNELSGLLENLSQGTAMLAEVGQASGIPEIAEKVGQLQGLMDEVVTMIAQGGAGAPAEQGAAPMEAGASGAQPMSPAGR